MGVEAALDASTTEHKEVSREPILLSVGVRIFFFSARRFYARVGAGVGRAGLKHPDDTWESETLFGGSVGVGYTWRISDSLELGPYAGQSEMFNDVHDAGFYSVGASVAYRF
jgi:hypothetical protein